MSLTCANISIGSSADAELIIEAVRLGHLPICGARLSHAQCREIRPGNVYVWKEIPENVADGTKGLSRWTDGHKWTASKSKKDSLIYTEVLGAGMWLGSVVSDDLPVLVSGAQQLALRGEANQLIKQCFSIVWNPTSEERTHWHLIAYYSVASRAILPRFQTGNIPCILPIVVTAGQYMSYKKFKADQRHYRTKQFSHKTSSGHATTKQSEAPPRRDRLAASSLSPSCSSERTSLSLSLTYVNPQCNRSGETPPRDSSQSWSPKSQLLPLLHLCSLNTIHHRSEVDRRHIAALDGCRLSISMLPSSHTTPTLPLPPMSRMREYDFV